MFIVSTTWVDFWESLSPTLVLKSSPNKLTNWVIWDTRFKHFSPVKLEYHYPHLTLWSILNIVPDTVTRRSTGQVKFLFSFFPSPSPSFFLTGLRALLLKTPWSQDNKTLCHAPWSQQSQQSMSPCRVHPCHLHSRPVSYLRFYRRPGHCFLETTGAPDNRNLGLSLGS